MNLDLQVNNFVMGLDVKLWFIQLFFISVVCVDGHEH